MRDPEFYVGYLPRAPRGLATVVTRVAVGLVAMAATVAAALVFGQAPFPASTFEFQNYKQFEGVVRERPYPSLGNYLLVAPGKHGAAELIRGLNAKTIGMKGSLIYRDGVKMIEALPGTIDATGGAAAPEAAVIDLGAVTLAGEIVDSKCYLGVMNPGEGKVHRDCAARCISGGIPPALIAKDASVAVKLILLTGTDRRILDFVAEPVEVTGRLRRSGNMLTLETEPAAIHRRE